MCKDVSIRLFALHCVVFKEILSDDSRIDLQRTLISISQWSACWGMVLIADKGQLLRVSRKKCPCTFRYFLHDIPVSEIAEHKYLGVTFTNGLTWSDHRYFKICAT